jgi:hypothetical protein
MNCIFCDDPLGTPYSNEHIIQSALGSKLKSKKLICRTCNNFFSTADSGDIDKALIDQFSLFRNLFSIWGDRRTPPPTLRNITTLKGHSVNLAPGGIPVIVKTVRQSPDQGDDGNTRIRLSTPSIDAALDQWRHLRRQFADQYVGIANATRKREFLGKIPIELKFGGPEALKAIIKNLYEFLFYLKRERGCDLPFDVRQFEELRSYVRYGKARTNIVASMDYKNQIDYVIEPTDLSNYIFVFGDEDQGIIYGFFIAFGHIKFSAILSTTYKDSSFSYGVKHTPGTFDLEFLENVPAQGYDTSVVNNYNIHSQSYMPIVQRKMEEMLNMYFDISYDQEINNMINKAQLEGWTSNELANKLFKSIYQVGEEEDIKQELLAEDES